MKRELERPNNLGIISLAESLSRDNNGYIHNNSKRRRIRNDTNWTVRDLPEIPYLYLKEKTSVVVLNDSPQSIANRIVESAKSLSCMGEYDGEKAKATLSSVDGTEFCIQLFRVTAKTNECIIVEMHRANGSAIVFHTIARTILYASKTSPSSVKSKGLLRAKTLKSKREDGPDNKERSDLYTCTMEIVDSLLKKDRIDANLLGMESLQLLTSTKTSSDSMVSFASDVVLAGGAFSDVKSTLVSLIANENDEHSDSEDSTNSSAIIEERHRRKMRVCALTALLNALEAKSTSLESMLDEKEWVGDDGVLSFLLSDTNGTLTNPHEAFLAAKCVMNLFKYSSTMKSSALEMGFSEEALLNVLGEAK